jgi:hypothetical protein
MRTRRHSLLLVTAAAVLSGCAAPVSSASPAQGRIWYCQGVDAAHPAGSLATVDIALGNDTLSTLTVQVPGVADVKVPPGAITVRVDAKPVASLEVADGGTSSSQAGSGCPAAP